jgi:hypothetical protein
MKKIITLGAVLALACSCGTGDRGELLNGVEGKRWSSDKPHGMSLIPGGTFTMGRRFLGRTRCSDENRYCRFVLYG